MVTEKIDQAKELMALLDFDNKLDVMSPWALKQYEDKYAWKDGQGRTTETWPDTAYRVVSNVLGSLGYTDKHPEFQKLLALVVHRKFMPGGRFLANSGRPYHQTNNCFMYRCEDSREGWADLLRKCVMALSSGGGVGVDYSQVRPRGQILSRTGGFSGGPVDPMQMVNEVARHVMSAGSRRSAIWAGLSWKHANCEDFIAIKDWSDDIRAMKEKDFTFPAPLDMTNISVQLDDEFFEAYHDEFHHLHGQARRVFHNAVVHMLRHGEPGFSVDLGPNSHETLRNPCCEITSADDSDVCCLGSVNMARFTNLEEFAEACRLGALFLLAGTVYSDVPHEDILPVREKNRRIGLGLMGIHEWNLKGSYSYGMNDELKDWLGVYEIQSDLGAAHYAERHGLNPPIKKRAIAPNGTIGIIAETTTGIEPIFAVAEKRRFYDNDGKVRYQYVINPTAQRLIQEGVDPDLIEGAYEIGYERRVKFQAQVQQYVDNAISGTINLPAPITDEWGVEHFKSVLLENLPYMRGITVYPEGARSGQPLTPVSYGEALNQTGVTFEEDEARACKGGVCGL